MTSKTFGSPSDILQVRPLMDNQRVLFNAAKAEALERGFDLMQDRTRRYVRRWREALAHVGERASVLDIGAGWMPPEVFDLLIGQHRLDYHAFDLDPTTVRELAELMAPVGLHRENFRSGEVSSLPFEKDFELVFSSHCLEHSVDIVSTLLEIRRVLRDGGHLFMSVPLGFDDSGEHLLFLGPDEWIALLAYTGFDVRSHSVGRVYIETSDLTILATRAPDGSIDETAARRLAEHFSKAGRTFLTHWDDGFVFPEGTVRNPEVSILSGAGTRACIDFPTPPRALILVRHPWSGSVRISDGERQIALDAYYHEHYLHGVDLTGFKRTVTVEVVGAGPLSKGCECAIAGALI